LISALTFRSQHTKARLVPMPPGAGPSSYGFMWLPGLVLLHIPLVVANKGARPGAILDARLIAPPDFADGYYLNMDEFHPSLEPGHDTEARFAHPIVVAGRSWEMRFARFKAETDRRFEFPQVPRQYPMTMEVRTDADGEWCEFWTFTLEVDERALGSMAAGASSIHWNPADRGPARAKPTTAKPYGSRYGASS
jgi:hypothetical protein